MSKGYGVYCTLYEISKEIYENVDESDDDWSTDLTREGRRLFMSVNDKCGLPYTVVLDSDYEKLCPWSDARVSGETWNEDFTDAVVENLASEADNREQRRKKREERHKKTK